MDAAKQIDREKVQQNAWRQGAVCPWQTLSGFLGSGDNCEAFPQSEGAIAILISHDCDIVNDSPTKGPFADWLIARPISEVSGVYLYGQNSRKFHFQHSGTFYEILAYERLSTPRELLERVSAEHAKLFPASLTKIAAEWLSKRYIRAAYPDAFNNRIKRVKKQLKKTLEKEHNHQVFRSILIKVSPKDRELSSDENYSVAIAGVMSEANYRDANKRERGQRIIDELETSLADCEGVEIDECMPRSDEEVRLSWLDYYVPWDFDDMTVQGEEEMNI